MRSSVQPSSATLKSESPGIVAVNPFPIVQFDNYFTPSCFGGNNPCRHWRRIAGVCVGSQSACNSVDGNSGSRLSCGLRSPVSVGRTLFILLRCVWRIRTFPVFQKKEKGATPCGGSDLAKEGCMKTKRKTRSF